MKTPRYTKEQLVEALASSSTIRQVLSKIGLVAAGGNYESFRRYVKKHDLDTSHLTGHAWSKGQVFGPKRAIETYLDGSFPITSHNLRLRLVSEGFFKAKCYRCNRTEWNGVPIPLELEHIDGKKANNKLTNLTLLCPNCHAQTPTYRGKNIGRSV